METNEQLVHTVDGMMSFNFPVSGLDTDELLTLNDVVIMELEEAIREDNHIAEKSLTILLGLVSGEITNRLARSYMQRHEVDSL